MIRLNSDGTADTAFNIGSGFSYDVLSISPVTDGSGDLYVGGEFVSYNGTYSNGLIRLNSDGTVDNAFNVGRGFGGDIVNSISLATDGSGDLYVGGRFSAYNGIGSNRLIRLNSDGSVDTAFDVGSGFNESINCIRLAADGSGKLYVGGEFTAYKGTDSNGLIRLNSDGSVDTTFNVDSGVYSRIDSISPAADGSGDLYVSGWFEAYNSSTGSTQLIRHNNDGTVDYEFSVGSDVGTVYSISPATDGSGDLFVGGAFKSYQSTTVDRIVRLNPDGSLN